MYEPQQHKADILAHCLWMAQADPTYAQHAAGWYEKNQPELLKNLAAKVRQEVARAQKEADHGPA